MNTLLRLALYFPFFVAVAASPAVARAQANTGGAPIANEPSQPSPPKDVVEEPGARRSTRRADHFSFGAVGSVGFPRPLGVEGLVEIERTVALGVEYSVLPQLTISGVETHFYAIAADARVFPFRGPFFVGMRAGRQHLGGNAALSISGYGNVAESISVDTTFLNPRLGFLWTWDPGITLGVDIGVQLPLSSTASNSLPKGVRVNTELSSVTDTVGKSVLPTIDLLQIGVML